MLGGERVGANRKSMKSHAGLIRAILNYGAIIYGSGAKSNLREQDQIHHGLRLCTGAF